MLLHRAMLILHFRDPHQRFWLLLFRECTNRKLPSMGALAWARSRAALPVSIGSAPLPALLTTDLDWQQWQPMAPTAIKLPCEHRERTQRVAVLRHSAGSRLGSEGDTRVTERCLYQYFCFHCQRERRRPVSESKICSRDLILSSVRQNYRFQDWIGRNIHSFGW